MKILLSAAALVVSAATATIACADPRLDEKVYTPYIQNGVAEFEVRSAGEVGGAEHGTSTTVLEAEYGVNDRLSLALVTGLQQAPHEAGRFTSVGLESVFYIGQVPTVGVDVGGYLEYKHGLGGEADVAEGKLLLAKTEGRFQGLVNLIVERPLSGPEAFASYGYAASATWRTWGALRLGAEAFGDVGDDHRFPGPQGAYLGPQLLWEGRPAGSPVEIDIDAGWLFPVGASRPEANSQFRIGLELERHF